MNSNKILCSILAVLFLTSCASAGAKVQLDTIGSIKTPYVFDVIGDTRDNDADYGRLVDRMVKDNPAVVFNVGDLTPLPCVGTDEFKRRSSAIKVPYLFAPGNHDIGLDNGACYLKWSGQPGLYYNFAIGRLSFIVLNSENLNETQIQWLKNTLTRDDNKKVVCFHRPLYASKLNNHLIDTMRQPLHELFKANHVAVVFQGHDHLYNQETVDGISYIVTGGGGAPLRRGGFYHYVRVTVKDALGIEVVDIDGRIKFIYNIPMEG